MLTIDSLQTGYLNRAVLHDVSLQIAPGEVVALIGPNGSGKSTLLRAVSGLLPLQHGSITVDNADVVRLSEGDRARRIAVVPQARNLPPAFSAREVVALGRTPYLNWFGQLSRTDEALIDEAMTQTETSALSERLVGELSGGEQQRILLARALVQQTPYLLLDEPTTHLDLQFQVELMQRIHDLAHPGEGTAPRGVLIAVHDLNLALEFADRVALLVEGKIIACDVPAEVLQPATLSQVYHIPLALLHDPLNGQVALLPKIHRNSTPSKP
jgi:iron complex transport system ATP-binding protein